LLVFFFFQAEDGIRDLYVTGVQTCALPISPFAVVPTGVARHAALRISSEGITGDRPRTEDQGLRTAPAVARQALFGRQPLESSVLSPQSPGYPASPFSFFRVI